MAIIGYARVSTDEQELALQTDALKAYGAQKLYTEKASGSKTDRPMLLEALRCLHEGDTFMVWKLDRLGRSVRQLVDTVQELHDRGIEFVSITDGINTETAAGRFFFHVMAALAEMERDLIRERTQAGLKAARARGRSGGRPKLDPSNPTIVKAKKMHASKVFTIKEICDTLSISQSALYRYLAL